MPLTSGLVTPSLLLLPAAGWMRPHTPPTKPLIADKTSRGAPQPLARLNGTHSCSNSELLAIST